MANNFVPLFLPLELLTILNEGSGKDSQAISTYVLKILVLSHREQIVSKYGQEVYDNLLKECSKDVLTQKREKSEREKAKLARQTEKLELRKKSLELKEKELSIRETNTEIRTEKIESEKPEPEPKLPEPEDPKLKEFFSDWKDRLEISETETEYQLKVVAYCPSGMFTELSQKVKGFNGHYVSEGKNSHFIIPKVTGKAEMSVSATNRTVTQPVSQSPNSQ